jgi:hypothetical protein
MNKNIWMMNLGIIVIQFLNFITQYSIFLIIITMKVVIEYHMFTMIYKKQ